MSVKLDSFIFYFLLLLFVCLVIESRKNEGCFLNEANRYFTE